MVLGFGTYLVVLPIKTQAGEKRITIEYLEADYGEAETLYQAWLVQEQNHKTAAFDSCSCVTFAKSETGFTEAIGYAKNWPINSEQPVIGGVVIFREGLAGHVAYIQNLAGDQIFIKEANYLPCKQTTRIININDPDILGFWKAGD